MQQEYEPMGKGMLALLLVPITFVVLATGIEFAYVLHLL